MRLCLFLLALGLSAQTPILSHIVTVRADGSDERLVASLEGRFEAPNWHPDGYLILNSGGKLWKLALTGGAPQLVATGDVARINNDHGVSPDGKSLVISAGPMYTLPIQGGVPKQITALSPSYYHGWSPDGKRLAYCAKRGDNFDLYDIDVQGGEERRLTTHAGYDDGPDYSPDGRWIYFNSDRTGNWEIWRIPASGAGPNDERAEQIQADGLEDWFPHPSPDGKWIVFLSFPTGTKGHPPDLNVQLRRMAVRNGRPDASTLRTIVRLFGGQGTINVNSWSPDSRRFAFVRYEKR